MKFTPSVLVGCALSLSFIAPPAAASQVLEITEWEVPWAQTRPRDPWVETAERIWFVGQRADYVAHLNPESGDFERFDLEAGAGPHTVIVNEAGAWYAGNRAAHIGRIDAESGAIEKIALPGDGRRDVHTMDFTSAGDIWFTVQHGNQIGFLEADSSEIRLYDVQTESARPYGLIVDEADQPWVVLFGTNRLATIDEGEVVEIELPRERTHPRRLAVTGDGMVWYVDYAGGYLGRYNPDTEQVDEWRAPGEDDSRPYAVASDADGRIWFVETGMQPNRFVGFDPETESFTDPVEIPSGGGTVRHMVFDERSNSFWFGTDANTIGRAEVK